MVLELNLVPVKFIISYSVATAITNETFINSKGTHVITHIEQFMGIPVEISSRMLDGQMILITREYSSWNVS